MKYCWVNAFLLSFLGLSSAFANEGGCSSIKDVSWILGNWTADTGKTVTLESWKQVSPATFEGQGITLSKKDHQELSKESLRLVEMSGAVFYFAKVSHNAHPVAFRLTHCAKDRAVFENPEHDFPRRLDYQLRSRTELVVYVSDGKNKGFQLKFSMKGADGGKIK